MAKVCHLFSGSSGNSIYIETKTGGILVDIGVSAKRCTEALSRIGVDVSSIKAILITHEHTDHVAGIRVFARKNQVPVYGPAKCLDEMRTCGQLNNLIKYQAIGKVFEIDGTIIEVFRNSHDSIDCVGYKFNLPDGRKVSVCTDTGYVTEDARNVIKGSDLVFLESNHEERILMNGSYPYPLKLRILSEQGHLSNVVASEFARDLYESGTTRFVLSHISKENNDPYTAKQTLVSTLADVDAVEGIDYRVYVSKPENEDGVIIL